MKLWSKFEKDVVSQTQILASWSSWMSTIACYVQMTN